MGAEQTESNPFTAKFVRKMNSEGAWITIGERKGTSFDVTVELSKTELKDKLLQTISNTLGIKTASEKILLRFLFQKAGKFDIHEESVFIDLCGAKKYTAASGKEVSKSSFQRAMKCFSSAGLIASSGKNSWFFLNPDIFSFDSELSIRTEYVLKKKTKKCSQTSDFFGGSGCSLVPRTRGERES